MKGILIFGGLLIAGSLFTIGFVAGRVGSTKFGCPYEGAECPNAKEAMREYQLELNDTTVSIYQNGRFVAETSLLEPIMIKDNE